MIIVSDATPLNVLVRLGFVEHLPATFGQVFIPPAVRDELTHPSTPQAVRDWIATAPSWLLVQAPSIPDPGPRANKGEREALVLAKDLNADRLLADDRKARKAAEREGIKAVGTLGLLEIFAAKGLLSLQEALDRRPRDFWLDKPLVDAALARDQAWQDARPAIGPTPSREVSPSPEAEGDALKQPESCGATKADEKEGPEKVSAPDRPPIGD